MTEPQTVGAAIAAGASAGFVIAGRIIYWLTPYARDALESITRRELLQQQANQKLDGILQKLGGNPPRRRARAR